MLTVLQENGRNWNGLELWGGVGWSGSGAGCLSSPGDQWRVTVGLRLGDMSPLKTPSPAVVLCVLTWNMKGHTDVPSYLATWWSVTPPPTGAEGPPELHWDAEPAWLLGHASGERHHQLCHQAQRVWLLSEQGPGREGTEGGSKRRAGLGVEGKEEEGMVGTVGKGFGV